MSRIPELFKALRSGDRRALAQAITLVESVHPGDQSLARELLALAAPYAGSAHRIGISGPPGAGKSTLIEALGLHLVAAGHRVAVLAVDPASQLTGGAILGDKVRMERLSAAEAAFIRPSSGARSQGGIAQRTGETLQLCAAAAYDILLVETVGVGQSEAAVADITDLFVLLHLPHTGDGLQAIKRGVVEFADIIAVNKADIDPVAARQAASQWQAAGRDAAYVRLVSARTGSGVAELWGVMKGMLEQQVLSGGRQMRRLAQSAARAEAWPAPGPRPFRILGIQQVAVGSRDKQRLRHLWVDLLGLEPKGVFTSAQENVDEDICQIGTGARAVEVDLMQPLDATGKPVIHAPALHHVGLWVSDLRSAVEWLAARGVRFAAGGIRRGAAGHDVCFVHPSANPEFPVGGEGVLIELVQAPPDVIEAFGP